MRLVLLSTPFVLYQRAKTCRPDYMARLTREITSVNLFYRYVMTLMARTNELILLPTKMDLCSDLPAMYRMIDTHFPLWRFSLAPTTQQDIGRSDNRGHFPLLWLAHLNPKVTVR